MALGDASTWQTNETLVPIGAPTSWFGTWTIGWTAIHNNSISRNIPDQVQTTTMLPTHPCCLSARTCVVLWELISLIERHLTRNATKGIFPISFKAEISEYGDTGTTDVSRYLRNSITLPRRYIVVSLCECVISELRALYANETRWQIVI